MKYHSLIHKLAAIYNIFWGASMIVGVYGLGYWLAAANPYQHYPIVLVGF